MKHLGKRARECNTRMVWMDRPVHPKDLVSLKDFSTWRPGEKIPVGERYMDSD